MVNTKNQIAEQSEEHKERKQAKGVEPDWVRQLVGSHWIEADLDLVGRDEGRLLLVASLVGASWV